MGKEGLQNLHQEHEPRENLPQHDRAMDHVGHHRAKSLTDIKLEYCEHTLHEGQQKSFADVLEHETRMIGSLARNYAQFSGLEYRSRRVHEYQVELAERIDTAYAERGLAGVKLLLTKERSKYTAPAEQTEIIRCEYESGLPHMAELGYNPNGDFVQLHLRAWHEQGGTGQKETLMKALQEAAIKIAEEYPTTQAVTFSSWLASHPICQRLGFTVLPQVPVEQHSPGVWAQLVSKDGTIDQKRAERLHNEGRLPHKAQFAYMDIAEFLQRYLPDVERNAEKGL